jgi:tetratricopeptide (TPR) repeat protein
VTDSGKQKARPPRSGPGLAPSSGTGPDSGAEDSDATSYLLRALSTKSPTAKKKWAQKGLALLSGGPGIAGEPAEDQDGEDSELHALLLRQIYLAEIDEGNDLQALRVAEQMIDLGTLGDVARQDAARAALGIDDVDAAIGHLRIAARVCPAGRRAFHYAHLGALLRFDGQVQEAIEAFSRANRWATEDRDLYQAQQALAEAAQGKTDADLALLRRRLESDADQKPYALWVLGELCVLVGDTRQGAAYLKQFLERQSSAPRAKALALKGEVAHASALLKEISA